MYNLTRTGPREEHPHLVRGIDCGGTIGSVTAPAFILIAPAPAFIAFQHHSKEKVWFTKL